MTQSIKHSLVLASTLAVLSSGCLLKVDGLDAGVDDSDDDSGDNMTDTLECLIGTEIDAVGVTQSSWSPGCEVTCDEGWGHDATQLPIAWTTVVTPYPPDAPSSPRAIGVLESGRVVVAIAGENHVMLRHFEADGADIGGYDVAELGTNIYSIAIASQVVYIVHGNDDGAFELRAVAGQQQLWAKTFAGGWPSKVARGGGKLAFVFSPDPDLPARELAVLDLDGETLWTLPTSNTSSAVAISPSGQRIAVAGDMTRVHAAADGELLDEFVNGSPLGASFWTVTFADEDRVVTAGALHGSERMDGWLAGDSLAGGGSWEHTYNRAILWCPEPGDSETSASTAEWVAAVTTLADGSLIGVGSEVYEQDDVYEGQPWVVRFSATGEFLARDRGLWVGHAVDTVAAPDGSVYVLIVGEGLVSEFTLRKYIP